MPFLSLSYTPPFFRLSAKKVCAIDKHRFLIGEDQLYSTITNCPISRENMKDFKKISLWGVVMANPAQFPFAPDRPPPVVCIRRGSRLAYGGQAPAINRGAKYGKNAEMNTLAKHVIPAQQSTYDASLL
jgi:hypothetical protein